MAEYIEREAISEGIRKYYYKNPPNSSYGEGFDRGLDRAQRAILDAPAADVAPVRHGRWEWFEEWSPSTPESPKECIDCGWRCGRCKVKLDDMVGWYWDDPYDEPKLNWCPNCGMRADEQNELNIN